MYRAIKRRFTKAGAVLLAPLLGGCWQAKVAATELAGAPPGIPATPNGDVISAQNSFGFALLSQLGKATPHQNIFISPFSINQALMLATNGAAGETQQALRQTLQIDGMEVSTANTQNAALRKTLTTVPQYGYGIQLVVANALWTDRRFPLAKPYIETCRTFYGAEVAGLDFTQAGPSAATINAWVSKKTKGLIPSIVTPSLFQGPPVQAVLTNAVYFKAAWLSEFSPRETHPQPFTLGNGRVQKVPMMQQIGSHSFSYFQGDGFTAARLPYMGGASLHVLLPDKGTDLSQLLGKLNQTNWHQWQSHWDSNVEMDLFLPRFKTEYSAQLIPTLAQMGMQPALSPAADFTPMGLSQGFIGRVLHKTYLDMDEKGTKAAAVTAGIAMAGGMAAPLPPRKKVVFRVDHPFVVAVVDAQGTILFLGSIHNPT